MKQFIKWAVAISSALLLIICYIQWLSTQDNPTIQSIVASVLSVILFYICLQLITSKLYDFLTAPPVADKPLLSTTWETRKKAWLKIVLWMVGSRLAIYIFSLVTAYICGKWNGSLLDTMQRIWTGSTDANSYLGIAENWYVTEGDARFHIVFFPLYPIMIKLFQFVLQDYFVSALVVSNLCALGSSLLLYELAALDMPSQKALHTVKYLFLLPPAIFFAAPMTESLFLLLSVGCIYLVRKRHYLPACLLGALASFTRSPGVILLAIIFIEYVRDLIVQYRKDGKISPAFRKLFFSRGCCMLIVPLGLLGYILINYLVTGNPFQFSVYQKEHWSQSFGYFFNTASVQANNLVSNIAEGNINKVLGLWLTNIVALFGSLGLMIAASKKVRPSYSAYYLAYFVITIGVTWLLSGPRYLTVVFPLAFAITALVGKRKLADMVVTFGLSALQCCYLAMFLTWGFHIY